MEEELYLYKLKKILLKNKNLFISYDTYLKFIEKYPNIKFEKKEVDNGYILKIVE